MNLMRVGIIGTGAIAHKHVAAYRNIGFEVVACAGLHADRGLAFAERYGCEFCARWEDVCQHPRVEFVDVCTFPDFRLEAVVACAAAGKHVQVQKPMAVTPAVARRMMDAALAGGIVLGVVSQHRFDDASLFLKRAIDAGRLGRLIEVDAYVKWWRSDEYYERPVKGSWKVEGGGALMNQGIHQVDLLLWLAGRVRAVSSEWQIGAVHRIESEDVVNALLRFESGATGVIQASTAVRPGYPERIEIHGTGGSAIITGDKLTAWDAEGDAPVESAVMSGASEPMAISTASFERQFLDFGSAIREGRAPLVSGEDGYRAVELVDAIYRSAGESRRVSID
jgi:UDP-N-acetyl-2-amino-2-deoxyglucuronate dehydrogenase